MGEMKRRPMEDPLQGKTKEGLCTVSGISEKTKKEQVEEKRQQEPVARIDFGKIEMEDNCIHRSRWLGLH